MKCSRKLQALHNDLPFFIEKIRPEKNEKLVYKFYDKKEYVEHIKTVKTSIKSWIILEKVA